MGAVNETATREWVLQEYRALQYATDVGLLDVAAILLGCIGILLAIFGFVGFYRIRDIALKQATEVAKEAASEIAEKTAIVRVEQELPRLYRAFQGRSAANAIAASQEEDQDQ